MKDQPVTTLTLVSSCACNLKCAYCQLANNIKNQQYAAKLQAGTIEAFKSGQYLKTTLDALKKFKSDPLDIEKIEFWGQEPTLTLRYFTEHLADWLETYPKVTRFIFSSNGVDYVDDIIEFIKAVDNVSTHEMHVDLQYSYDGDWATSTLRGVDPNRIKNNAYKLLNTFANEYKLRHTMVDLGIHRVLSLDLIRYLDTKEKVDHYEDDYCLFQAELQKIIKTKTLPNKLHSGGGPGLETPVLASKEDGELITKFLNKYEEEHPDFYKKPESIAIQMYEFITHELGSSVQVYNAWKNPLEAYKELIYNTSGLRDELESFLYCSAFKSDMKIRYDGTVLSCQTFMFDTDEDNILAQGNNMQANAKLQLLKHGFHYNIYTDSDEKLAEIQDIHQVGRHSNILNLFHQCMSMLTFMAKSGQILPKYKYPRNIITDAILLVIKGMCQYNSLVLNGTFFLRDTGFFRLYCNGLLEKALQFYKNYGGDVLKYAKYEY